MTFDKKTGVVSYTWKELDEERKKDFDGSLLRERLYRLRLEKEMVMQASFYGVYHDKELLAEVQERIDLHIKEMRKEGAFKKHQ